MQLSTIVSIVGWVVTGAIAGYIASLVLRAERQGCFINVAIGVAGAFVGAFLLRTFLPGVAQIFGTGPVAQFFNGVVHAIVGAVIILVAIEIIVPGKQLGVRREKKTRRRR